MGYGKGSDPGSIAPAATAKSRATMIGPAMLGAADARSDFHAGALDEERFHQFLPVRRA